MASPFPGMDPYLEGYLWSDVHQSLAAQFKRQLGPLVRPNYVVRLAMYFVNDLVPAQELGIVYPDLEVVRPYQEPVPMLEPAGTAPSLAITPPAIKIPAAIPLEVRLTSIHVMDVAQNELVTSIEILSPVNKREPGLSHYRQKRTELLQAGVHLLEIDLVRRGGRAWFSGVDELPISPYLMVLTRAHQPYAELWPVYLDTPLPVLPVPLRSPDADIPLDIKTAVTTIYEESDYDRTIDYRQPPPPPSLSRQEKTWVDAHLQAAGLRQ
jgi:hypothetical protein